MTEENYFEEILNLILSILNEENGKETADFNIMYVNNTEYYNASNLIFNEQVKGVLTLSNSVQSSIISDSTNRTDYFNLRVLVPLKHDKTVYFRNKLMSLLPSLANQIVNIYNYDIYLSNFQVVNDSKYPQSLNGYEYEDITISFQAILNEHFVFINSNDQKLIIDNNQVSCIISVSLTSQKMLQANVFTLDNGIAKNQYQGLQYALGVNLILNKDDPTHLNLLSDYKLLTEHQVKYSILDSLQFNRTCIVSQYVLSAISGDTVKLQLTFTEKM